MRNKDLERLDVLAGRWDLTMANAWFLEPEGATVAGACTVEWLGDGFLVARSNLGEPQAGGGTLDLVLGRSDANDAFYALYHDDRGVGRLFDMTFDGARWTLVREDPDMHQRFTATVTRGRIEGYWEASEDQGSTWRKDFDLIFDRVPGT